MDKGKKIGIGVEPRPIEVERIVVPERIPAPIFTVPEKVKVNR